MGSLSAHLLMLPNKLCSVLLACLAIFGLQLRNMRISHDCIVLPARHKALRRKPQFIFSGKFKDLPEHQEGRQVGAPPWHKQHEHNVDNLEPHNGSGIDPENIML
jgi:hypothetical protein